MSDEETQIVHTEDGQMLTAEYKDGKLQIVEVTAFDKGNETHILPDLNSDEQTKYLQVLDSSKGVVHLDLLNFTLVKCSEGDGASYQVVGTSSSDDGETLTCVLSNEDTEDNENQDSYVMMNTEEGDDPLVYLQSSLQQINTQQNLRKPDSKKQLTPTEILEKAKVLQKAKALLQRENETRTSNRGRKRKSDLPPPMELLSSPNFKLYLYSCKLCSFKCNAIKEMSKHKLMKHVQNVHFTEKKEVIRRELCLDSEEVADADVLVCGACGFESGDRDDFRKHIERVHGVNVMVEASMLSIEETSQSN